MLSVRKDIQVISSQTVMPVASLGEASLLSNIAIIVEPFDSMICMKDLRERTLFLLQGIGVFL